MKNSRARLGAALLALMCATSLAACSKQTNTEGNPEVGTKTGAVAGRREVRMAPNAVNPDVTNIPTPSGKLPQQVPTVPEANLNLNPNDFMANCRSSCNPDSSKDTRAAAYCEQYCGCSYQKMDATVPIADLRAFARNEQNPSTVVINKILQQCSKLSLDRLNGRMPQASGQSSGKTRAGG